MKSLKLTDYFQIIRPEYVYLKLTPITSIRNYQSDKIAKSITAMHKTVNKQFKKRGKTIFFETIPKVSYYIYIEKGKVEFYFIVPKLYLGLIKEKITDTWKGITVTEINQLPQFDETATAYYLTYIREDAMSLAVDRRNNDLLASTLNVIEVMEQGDRVGIFYNFIPVTQFGWRAEHEQTIDKLRHYKPVDRKKLSVKYISKALIVLVTDVTNMLIKVIGDMFGSEDAGTIPSIIEVAVSDRNAQYWSKATNDKKEKLILNTQIMVMSDSSDMQRASNNAISVCESFQSITEDNTLIYKRCRITKTFNMLNTRITNIDKIKTSVDECQNFLSLPGRELLEQHNCIEKVDTIESEVPEELKQGIMCIGENTCKGNKTKAYLTTDKEYQNLTLCIIGPNRAGKSTLIGNLNKDGLDHNECNIIFDFCGNAELSSEVAALFPAERVLAIDCSDFDKMQGLGYNEVKEGNDTFEKYRNAKMQTAQLVSLINSIVGNDSELKNRMERYLEGAANVVFLQRGSIRDVFLVLQDHKLREQYIKGVPAEQRENLAENISALEELDEWSKGNRDNPPEIIGTKISYVQGILNRVNKLKANAYMELMLKKDCENNIDLVEEIQRSQLICLKMPEVMFATETEKDIYCTYWLTKIWLALQVRKSMYPTKEIFDANTVKVNLFIDELYQVPQTQDFLRSKLSQMPKFRGKTIISCHHLKQIPIIRDELKSANCSYMLLAGSNKENYQELKGELYPYQEEDLLNLKRYHSLNLLKTNNGFAKFITKLPPPIK